MCFLLSINSIFFQNVILLRVRVWNLLNILWWFVMECWVFLLHKPQVKKNSVDPTDKLIECNNVPR